MSSTTPRRKRRRTAVPQETPGEAVGGYARAQGPPPPSYLNAPSTVSDRDLAALLSYGPSHLPYSAAWTDSRIEQVRAYKHWVYIAIRTIARKIASATPNVTFVRDSRNKSPGVTPHQGTPKFHIPRHKALLPLHAHEEIDPAGHDHPLSRLLADPNDPDTAYDLLYETILFLLLTGSAYWWVPRDPVLGLPTAAWVIPSHWIWPIMGKDRFVEAWELRPVEGNYLRRQLPADEVIVFRDKNPISKLDGYSPLTAGAQWCDILSMVNTSRWWAYRNGTFPTVAVQFDGTYDDPSDEDLRRIEAKFAARYTGETRSNKPLFLPPGVKASPLTLTANEMVFGETAKETRDNILALFGVPPVVAGIMDGLTYGSLVAAMQGFYTLTINPLFRFIGQNLTEKLARIYDPNLRVWWEDATPEDPDLREKQLATDLLAGAITPNEIRLMRGRQPYPDDYVIGNDPVFPVNMTTANMLPLGGDSTNSPDVTAPGQPKLSQKDDE